MSEPTRYRVADIQAQMTLGGGVLNGGILVVDPAGPIVAYGAYAKLQADNERLKAEVERLTERNKFLEQIDSYLQGANEHSFEQRCDELEAEVERLRKAGDAMAECLDSPNIHFDTRFHIRAWNAAKEGKQS